MTLVPDQIIGKMVYFYKILANNDGFGQATIQKLYEKVFGKLVIFTLWKTTDLMSMGFGEKTSQNLD